MTEELKSKKLDEEMMDNIAGGSSKEMESDERLIGAMLGLNSSQVNPGVVGDAFKNAKITLEMHSGDAGNVYKFNGRRISRYEALVRMVRGNGHPKFDVSPYLADSHGDNNSRNLND